MSNDNQLEDEYIKEILDRFDVYDIVEALGLTTEDLVDKFRDEILGSPELQAALRL